MDEELERKYIQNMLMVIADEDGFDEMAHEKLDEILCSFIEELGYTKLASIYKKADKWYM